MSPTFTDALRPSPLASVVSGFPPSADTVSDILSTVTVVTSGLSLGPDRSVTVVVYTTPQPIYVWPGDLRTGSMTSDGSFSTSTPPSSFGIAIASSWQLTATPTRIPSHPPTSPNPISPRTGAGLGVAGFVILASFAIGVYLFLRRRTRKDSPGRMTRSPIESSVSSKTGNLAEAPRKSGHPLAQAPGLSQFRSVQNLTASNDQQNAHAIAAMHSARPASSAMQRETQTLLASCTDASASGIHSALRCAHVEAAMLSTVPELSVGEQTVATDPALQISDELVQHLFERLAQMVTQRTAARAADEHPTVQAFDTPPPEYQSW